MDTPHIIAVEDVRLTCPPDRAEATREFYTQLLGLDLFEPESNDRTLTFRAYPRSGCRLIMTLDAAVDSGSLERPPLVIQVASLTDIAEAMDEAEIAYTWSRGWDYFDRRLCTNDPAANAVELVERHEL